MSTADSEPEVLVKSAGQWSLKLWSVVTHPARTQVRYEEVEYWVCYEPSWEAELVEFGFFVPHHDSVSSITARLSGMTYWPELCVPVSV